ncbi:GNAT family N-acetyltransferase [Kerstersia gyiorum]|uniref:GNAT family N-acetyltransferase n=1 Tax=Kerstersia gyiorum TaxID=206506 RepID=UPI0030CF7C25
MLKAIKIDSNNSARNPIIQDLARKAHNGFSSEFVFVRNDVEVAFLCYDNNPRYSSGFIYEIYVICEFRKQGLGSEILAYVESLAKKDGKSAIRLEPRAFDRTLDEGVLIAWYTRKGYSWATDDPKKMEKQLG